MTKTHPAMDLLKLISACGGEIETRIKIQKEVYLLSSLFPDFFESMRFEYHHYGPYSRSLSEVLQLTVISGLIEEIDETPTDQSFTKYKYAITKKGKEVATDLHFEDERFHRVAGKLNGENWRTLELAATVKFLENREGLDKESAFTQALRLKPATTAYEARARQLLAELN